jgi:uncharacterized protein GlcG (DUF336 family)
MRLNLAAASALIDAAIADGRQRGAAPLAVAVLDAGTHLIALKREDGASLLRPQIAIGKASGALGMGWNTREIARRAAGAPLFFNGLMAMSGDILPSPGGVLIKDAEGTILGAVGISGDVGDVDEACALAGIAAAGFEADGQA